MPQNSFPELSVHLINIMAITALLEVLHPLFRGRNFVSDETVMSRGNLKFIRFCLCQDKLGWGGWLPIFFILKELELKSVRNFHCPRVVTLFLSLLLCCVNHCWT